MKELRGNLWDYVDDGYIVITTNGAVNRKGECVMGRGTALQAKNRYPGVALELGNLIKKNGNHARLLCTPKLKYGLIAFPVKHHWQEPADPELISRSAWELVNLIMDACNTWNPTYMCRPGCGNGGLTWDNVKPLLGMLDDRFTIVDRNA